MNRRNNHTAIGLAFVLGCLMVAFAIYLGLKNADPPPDDYVYTVRPHAGTLAIVALNIRSNGRTQRLTGSDVCIQLFDILHHR